MIDQPRIAIVTPFFPPVLGGAEMQLELLALAFSFCGACVDVFTSSVEIGRHYANEKISIKNCFPAWRDSSQWCSDLVYALKAHAPYDGVLILLSSVHPSVAVTAAEVSVRCGSNVLMRISSAGRFQEMAFGDQLRLKAIPVRFVVHSSSERSALVVSGVDSCRVLEIPNAVNPRFLLPASPAKQVGAVEGRRVFIYAGRFDVKKRLSSLLDAWSLHERLYPEAELHIIGSDLWEQWKGRKELGRELKESAGLRSLKKIVFGGLASLDGMLSEYQGADVAVNPSSNEGMSNFIVEAMGMSLPVICSNIRANAFVPGAWKCDLNNPESLSSALGEAQAMGDQDLNVLGTSNRKWVEDNATISKVVQRYCEVFGWVPRKWQEMSLNAFCSQEARGPQSWHERSSGQP
jgi:glycosyltransferase involved in cell wall biosynthesis